MILVEKYLSNLLYTPIFRINHHLPNGRTYSSPFDKYFPTVAHPCMVQQCNEGMRTADFLSLRLEHLFLCTYRTKIEPRNLVYQLLKRSTKYPHLPTEFSNERNLQKKSPFLFNFRDQPRFKLLLIIDYTRWFSKVWKELEMEINAVGPADVRINIYEKCRGGSISVLILIGATIAYTRTRVYLGFDAFERPPRKLTGTRVRKLAMSYPPAINPVWDDLKPNLLSIVVMTTFTKPFTTIPENTRLC